MCHMKVTYPKLQMIIFFILYLLYFSKCITGPQKGERIKKKKKKQSSKQNVHFFECGRKLQLHSEKMKKKPEATMLTME